MKIIEILLLYWVIIFRGLKFLVKFKDMKRDRKKCFFGIFFVGLSFR